MTICTLSLVTTASGAQNRGDHDLAAALAYVKARCPTYWRVVNRSEWERGWTFNALYGSCLAGDGGDQHIWFFAHGRFVGKDVKGSSSGIIGMWRDDRTIAFMYVLYRPGEAMCCPTGGGKIVRFRWTGRAVKALDSIPRHRSP